MSRIVDIYDGIGQINQALKQIRVVAWLMVAFGAAKDAGDMIQQKEIGDIGCLIADIADEMKEHAAKLEAQVEIFRQTE